MMKYVGTRVSSKKRKKRKRSRARKLPRHAHSSSSIQATKPLGLLRTRPPSRATGNSTPHISTRNSDIPSMPSFHEMPNWVIQLCWETIWNPASPTRKRTAMNTARPSTATEKDAPITSTSRWRAFGSAATTTAPPAGISTSVVSSGKPGPGCPVAATSAVTSPPGWPRRRAPGRRPWRGRGRNYVRSPSAAGATGCRCPARAWPYR